MSGGADLDFLCEIPDFEQAYNQVTVPEMLAVLFANQMRLNLGVDTNTMIVDLFVVYADLLDRIDEVTAQRAMMLGVPTYFDQVLQYGNRPNLLTENDIQGDIYELI